jgi:hypothetical protein
MSVLLSNYSNLTPSINLSNSSDVIANSYSLIEGNDVVDIKDLIAAAGEAIDAYTKAEVDSSLLLKQDSINWITGNSDGKNTISTGEGELSIALPDVNGTFTDVIRIKGPNTTGEEGHATFYNKVIMNEALEVSGAITMGGMSVLTTDTGYTKAQVDDSLLLKQNTLNWILGNSSGSNTISTGEGVLSIALPGASGTFTDAIRINGPNITGEEGQSTFYQKVIMNEALEVSGGITMGGLSVLTTGTAYTKDETLTQSEVNDMLSQSLTYIDGQVAPLQALIAPVATNTSNIETLTANLGSILYNNVMYKYHSASATQHTTSTLTIDQMLKTIVICTSSSSITLTLPNNTSTQNGMKDGSSEATFNSGFEWSMLNTGTEGVIIAGGLNHGIYGRAVVNADTSARFYTKIGGGSAAYTYRLA